MRLLIAHGSQAARQELADALRSGRDDSLEILTAAHGEEALAYLLEDDPPAVAVIDWDLPSIDGPELCRLVRDFNHGSDTWLVVLAGAGHPETADAWRAGAAACVAATAGAGALGACVEEGLRRVRGPLAEVVPAER